jgi:hypothetical protein
VPGFTTVSHLSHDIRHSADHQSRSRTTAGDGTTLRACHRPSLPSVTQRPPRQHPPATGRSTARQARHQGFAGDLCRDSRQGGAEGTRTLTPTLPADCSIICRCAAVRIAYGVRDSGRISNGTNGRERDEWLPKWLPDDLAFGRLSGSRQRGAHDARKTSSMCHSRNSLLGRSARRAGTPTGTFDAARA